MGVWDEGSFGNDTALDFAADVSDFNVVCTTITKLGTRSGRLDVDDACIALAACDMVAAALGRPPADLPDLPSIESEAPSEQLLSTSRALIESIRKSSELADLWAQDDDSKWQKALDCLLIRLDPSKPYKAPTKRKDKLPQDFIGYCYICYGEVTEANGLVFEHVDGGAILANFPHRKCIEDQIDEPGPYWNSDGSPMPLARKQLMRGLGFEDV